MLNLNEAENRVLQLRRELEQAEANLVWAHQRARRSQIFENILADLRADKRINAIKELRSLPENGSTINLIDAKDIIEFICNNFKLK